MKLYVRMDISLKCNVFFFLFNKKITILIKKYNDILNNIN